MLNGKWDSERKWVSNSIISAGRAACLWEWAHLTAACAAAEAVSLCRWIWTGVSKRWSHSVPNCEICISLGLQNVPPGKIFLKGCPSFRNCQINLVTNDFLLGGERWSWANTFWVLWAVALEPQADHADEDDHHHDQDNYEADDTWGWRKELSAIDTTTLPSLASGVVQGLDSSKFG